MGEQLFFEVQQEQAHAGAIDRVTGHELRVRKTLVDVFVDDVGFVENQVALDKMSMSELNDPNNAKLQGIPRGMVEKAKLERSNEQMAWQMHGMALAHAQKEDSIDTAQLSGLDKAINDFERMINKIFDFCNEKGVGLGKQTAFRMFDDADEDSDKSSSDDDNKDENSEEDKPADTEDDDDSKVPEGFDF